MTQRPKRDCEAEFVRTREILRKASRPNFPIDPTYGAPLYGFDPAEMKGRACCEWATFISSFCYEWELKFNMQPMMETVKTARQHWSRHSMTGWESFITIRNML